MPKQSDARPPLTSRDADPSRRDMGDSTSTGPRSATDATTHADAAAIREQLKSAGVRLLAMTMVDNGGVTRVKAIPVGRLERVAQNGVGMSDLWAVAGVDDHFAQIVPYDTPSGDMRLIPDVRAARPLHAAPGWGWAPIDQHDQELRILPTCQRSALRRILAAAAQAGIEFKATFEAEMTLLREDGRPAHAGPGYSARALGPLEPFAISLVEALEAQEIQVEQLHPEYAPGQFEVSVAPTDPLAAADNAVLLRITAQHVARQYGMDVSFAPVVLPGEVGNGAHLHLSAWRDGENLLRLDEKTGRPAGAGAPLVAGVLSHLPEMLAVLAPTVAAYHRLQPSSWAGAYACWGIENREAALRLIPGSASSRPSSTNLEIKSVDGAANPYLATAVSVGAALHGMAEHTPLPAPVQVDPATMSEQERADAGIGRLATSLAAATDLLETSVLVREVLGPQLHSAFVAVRRLEWDTFHERTIDQLAEVYRFRY